MNLCIDIIIKKVVILIDEYDVPIQDGYLNQYYNDIVGLIKGVFSSALKGNINLDFAVMTGVLRVSKESLFSDLNNLKIYSIMESSYNEAFGFTTKETKTMLEYYGLKLNDEVKKMYDGYNFGGLEIYNPWSIINYCDDKKLLAYWVNTSGNELVIDLIKNADKTKDNVLEKDNVKITIEKLLSGESVDFIYNDKITYLDFKDRNMKNNVLNLLFASGYLTIDSEGKDRFGNVKRTVKLPNEEVKIFLNNIILSILIDDKGIDEALINNFCNGTLDYEPHIMEECLNKILPDMSFLDESESFYHGYVLGPFSMMLNENYVVRSNRESGSGRFDVMIRAKDNSVGVVIEFKITADDMELSAKKALDQIEEKEYYEELLRNDVEIIHKYGIVFKGKKCIVR